MELVNQDTKEALNEKIRVLEERISAQEDMLNRTTGYMSKIQEKLEDSKRVVEQKNEEINDSLRYARRLQQSLRPDTENISDILSDHFIHLKETQLIGGDLAYGRCTEKACYIAAIDCTGHGIPGAMLSMMAYSYLDEIILHLKEEQPAAILDNLNKLMYCALRSRTEDIKDGLDIALLRVDHSKKKVAMASARRPIIHIPNGTMNTYAGTKASIAESDASQFEQIDLDVKPGHKFYLFSDGMTDQFGGPNDKKFGRKRLTHLLAAIKDLHMTKQYEIINNTLESWRGVREQTDDQVMIGIKI